ncbi:MAG: hypothetical protein JWM18_881 [Chloroflexi bacterium]|jgi:glycosyltransferase involved in cell wall biosynthesis|nr:hypothetical protein [Chloroflexota bacterium]
MTPPSMVTTSLSALKGRRILFMNWRCLDHPRAGGAETFVFEVARRFVRAGAGVTVFAARPRSLPRDSTVDGIRLVRRGEEFSVYAHGAMYLAQHRGDFDVIVDCQNGIPFYAALFAGSRTRVVCVIHHVHQQQFNQRFGRPMSSVGRFLEGPASRAVYGTRPVAVVSPSTRQMVRRQLGLRGPLFVVPNGSYPTSSHVSCTGPRAQAPTIASVGRLVPHKRTELLIEAVPSLLAAWPDLRVEIVGDGPERGRLEALIRRLALEETVTLRGYVSRDRLNAVLRSAWISVNASDGEGWGLSVIEANALGRPVVARRVPGLRDSIVDGVTGWLYDGHGDLAVAIDRGLRVTAHQDTAAALAERCRSWAAQFSWDSTAGRLAAVIAEELLDHPDRRTHQGHRSDLACMVEFEVRDPEHFAERAAHVLRPTDMWVIDGLRVRLLLYGCDEGQAAHIVARLGVTDAVRARVATGHDLLVPFASVARPAGVSG